MRLALTVGYSGTRVEPRLDLVEEADRLGCHSVWAAEAYGSDVVTMLTWYGAHTDRILLGAGIMQIPGRTPAMTAMTAVTLSELTGGRFLLGLGVSGPQVAEGWHGRPYAGPLGRAREYVEIVRRMMARERVRFDGAHYRLPYDGEGSTGLGKPLRLTIHPRHDIPIYLASMGPRNVALTAEIADGWLPFWYSPKHAGEVFAPALAEGFAASGEEGKAERFDVVATAPAVLTDDPDQARWAVKPMLALYVGGMGAAGRNFYYDLVCRYGYEEAAEAIQGLYLRGKREEAIAAVPDALVDEVSLIGPREALRDRLEVWKESGVTTLAVIAQDVETLRALAELM
jgi:F420-dependent oxidoreductase-like protein